MSGLGILAVGIGAAAGAWLRWLLGLLLNTYFPSIPPGTVAANLGGGFVIGAAIVFFSQVSWHCSRMAFADHYWLCGGLTNFSTFSAEIATLLQEGKLALLAGAIALHVGGSLAMTLMGIASWRWFGAR